MTVTAMLPDIVKDQNHVGLLQQLSQAQAQQVNIRLQLPQTNINWMEDN